MPFIKNLAPGTKFKVVGLNETGTLIRANDCRAVVSINMAPPFRSNGLGKQVLRIATQELFGSSKANAVNAYVKLENERSLCLFAGAGFKRQDDNVVAGQHAAHFVLKKATQ